MEDNVLISSSGTAMICDFGIMRVIKSSEHFGLLTDADNKSASQYLAYELLTDVIHTTASDVWAFGMGVHVSLFVRFYLKLF